MIYSRTLFSVLAILFAFGGSPTHALIPNFSMLELAEQSDVVFSGKVTAVGEDSATVLVAEILSGKLDEALVSVSPIRIQHCVGGSINFIVDDKVLVFGKKSNGNLVIVTAGGQGKLRLDPEREERTMRAAKQILAIVPLKEDQKNRAMLAFVKDDNETLRSESHRYVVTRISHSKLANQYKETLISLIEDREAETQRTGLQAMQFVQARDSIARIVELTRSENLGVVSAASMALGQYDTEESVAALIALTKHANPEVRIRACIDIDRSRRPEAKEALRQLLEDEDPRVRAMGPRGLVYWLRSNEADDLLAKLIQMLSDTEPEVRASVAYQLGECRNPELVPPLIAALKREAYDETMTRAILQALYCHYSKGDARAKEFIDDDIELVIAALKSGGVNDAFGPSFHAVSILGLSGKPEAKEALKWAAQSHPNDGIRAYAKRSLPDSTSTHQ